MDIIIHLVDILIELSLRSNKSYLKLKKKYNYKLVKFSSSSSSDSTLLLL